MRKSQKGVNLVARRAVVGVPAASSGRILRLMERGASSSSSYRRGHTLNATVFRILFCDGRWLGSGLAVLTLLCITSQHRNVVVWRDIDQKTSRFVSTLVMLGPGARGIAIELGVKRQLSGVSVAAVNGSMVGVLSIVARGMTVPRRLHTTIAQGITVLLAVI